MKAQLATPAAGSPARSPTRVQRQASAGPSPDTPRGLPARAGRSEYAAIHAAAARGIATPWSAPPHTGAIQRSFGRHDVPSTQAHAGDAAATAAPAPSSPVQHPARGANAPMQAAPSDIARQDGAAEGDASSEPGVPAFAFGKAVAFAGVPGMRPSTQVLGSRAIAQPKLSIDGPRGTAAATAIAPAGGGSPLPDPTRARMERLFGLHLDGVRVVESGQPEQLGARALTIGHEIHAARGEDLAASRNTELLGHELAHVVQQRQGRARPDAAQDHSGALVVDAALEAEADAVGARIGRGEPAGIGGAAAACPAPVAQGYQIKLKTKTEPFTKVDELIEAFEGRNLMPTGGWKAAHRTLLFQWMREDRSFESGLELINALNTPAPRPVAAPTTVGELVERYENIFRICTSAAQIRTFVGPGRAITQVPQERGDMYDVASALALDPGLRVVVFPEDGVADCDKILDFYRDFAGRVCLVDNDELDREQLIDGQKFLRVSRSTHIMYQHRNHQAFRARLVDATTGRRNPSDEAAFEEELVQRGFQRGTRYALVMYRDSGHNPGPGRAPSHPELDTGTQGFSDLLAVIRGAGLIPVPMGAPPQGFNETQPNLINYWAWDCFRAYPEDTVRRQKENALLRYLGERYRVVAIGMRSGGMDALAYAGIPIISIDAAVEFMPNDDPEKPQIKGHSATSWRRAVKKEAMLPGRYHNVYLKELRADPHFRNLYRHGAQHTGPFLGEFRDGNRQRLTDAVVRYFGPKPSARDEFDPTSPLSYPGAKELVEGHALDRMKVRDRREALDFLLSYAKDPAELQELFRAYGY